MPIRSDGVQEQRRVRRVVVYCEHLFHLSGGRCYMYSYMYFSQIKAIKLVTGVTVTCWRPPYGDVDVGVLPF